MDAKKTGCTVICLIFLTFVSISAVFDVVLICCASACLFTSVLPQVFVSLTVTTEIPCRKKIRVTLMCVPSCVNDTLVALLNVIN